MNDPLYTIVLIAVVVITGAIVWVSYYVVETLKKAHAILDNIEDTTDHLDVVKQALKTGAFGIGSYVLSKLISGGDSRGKK